MEFMKVDLGIWNKLTKLVICLLLVAGAIAVCVWYLPVIQQNEHMRRELQRLDTQIKQERDTGKRLTGSIAALHHDPKTIERLAREKLGYARTGEVVIHFEEAASTNSPAGFPR